MIIVTGATGNLGRHVIDGLLERVPAERIVAAVRDPNKASDMAKRGIVVRRADYDEPETLEKAFEGAEKILLISASDIGRRAEQHRNILDAANRKNPGLLVYTSLLHADSSTITLAEDHRVTEKMILDSGLNYVILRNGWYIENYTENLGSALEHGVIMGSAGDGKIAAASRQDFAAAAIEALTGAGHTNRTYELAGDEPFTMEEYAAVVSKVYGKTVVYEDMPADAYKQALESFGLPEPVAAMLVSADLAIRNGELNDERGDLSRLIGRPTTSLVARVKNSK
ncbi:MAG: SDR family oxidoreductase [Bradymonadaceae bacterium]